MNARRLSRGPHHHFFGYYGITPWNKAGTKHLALETDFDDRRPAHADRARVGLIDRESGRFDCSLDTSAFNFQQGAMLHWISAGHGEEFTCNAWIEGKLGSYAVSPDTGGKRPLAGAIAAVSPDGRCAISLSYDRHFAMRPVVGYAPADPRRIWPPYPEDDGLWALNLADGTLRLLLSTAEIIRANPMPQTTEGPAWLDHVLFNPAGTRIFFMCRIRHELGWYSSIWTVGSDGGGLRCLIDYRFWISHFAWKDDRSIVVSTDVSGTRGFVLVDEENGGWSPYGRGALPEDGHFTFGPDRRLAACDTYPRSEERLADLLLYEPAAGRTRVLGSYRHPRRCTGDIRCDLHPRWSRDGQSISFDSVHEGSRQIYLIAGEGPIEEP